MWIINSNENQLFIVEVGTSIYMYNFIETVLNLNKWKLLHSD